MIQLPPYPSADEPVSATWGRRLIDYIRAITPRQSATVRVSTLPGGTTFDASRAGGRQAQAEETPGEADIGGTLQRSVETSADGFFQIAGFDKDEQVGTGLQDCLEADPETGKLKAVGGEQYEIMVRFKNAESGLRAVGFMPFAESAGEDPVVEEDPAEDDCKHDGAPGGGAGGHEENDLYVEESYGGKYPTPGGGDGSARYVNGDRDHGDFPSKTGPCW
jgi:hypothetical protein